MGGCLVGAWAARVNFCFFLLQVFPKRSVGGWWIGGPSVIFSLPLFWLLPKNFLGCWMLADVGGWASRQWPFLCLFFWLLLKKFLGCSMWVVGGWASRQEETDFPDGGSSPAPPPTILPPSLPGIKWPSMVIFLFCPPTNLRWKDWNLLFGFATH